MLNFLQDTRQPLFHNKAVYNQNAKSAKINLKSEQVLHGENQGSA